MDNNLALPEELRDARIPLAHAFFSTSIKEWAEVDGDPDKAHARLAALADVLQQRLQIVAIDLASNDDDQLIFETLNDRGTPLLAADLIKNYIFQRCEDLGADVDAWSATYWADFDEDWWRNPRAGEPLLGAGARGGTLSVESWAEELGASGADSLAWWFEVGA
jgi:hypothetical protein